MARATSKTNGSTQNEGMMSDTILTGSEGGAGDFLFEYDSNLEDAVQPNPLPEGRSYYGTVDQVKAATSQLDGKPQVVMTIIVPPEEYPADFPHEHHPDGVRLTFYSPQLANDFQGRFNAKRLAAAFKVPGGASLRGADFLGKRVKVNVQHKTRDDGSVSMLIKGLPEAE